MFHKLETARSQVSLKGRKTCLCSMVFVKKELSVRNNNLPFFRSNRIMLWLLYVEDVLGKPLEQRKRKRRDLKESEERSRVTQLEVLLTYFLKACISQIKQTKSVISKPVFYTTLNDIQISKQTKNQSAK